MTLKIVVTAKQVIDPETPLSAFGIESGAVKVPANQAPVVSMLYDSLQRGVPEVGDETLLSAVDPEAPPARLSVLFREHPAWGGMIVPGRTKGTHRLEERENI